MNSKSKPIKFRCEEKINCSTFNHEMWSQFMHKNEKLAFQCRRVFWVLTILFLQCHMSLFFFYLLKLLYYQSKVAQFFSHMSNCKILNPSIVSVIMKELSREYFSLSQTKLKFQLLNTSQKIMRIWDIALHF